MLYINIYSYILYIYSKRISPLSFRNAFLETRKCSKELLLQLFCYSAVPKFKEQFEEHLCRRTSLDGCFYKMYRGGSREFKNGGALYVGQHCWLAKKSLGFRWSKKAEITLENIYFYQYFQVFLIFIDNVLSNFQNLLTLR